MSSSRAARNDGRLSLSGLSNQNRAISEPKPLEAEGGIPYSREPKRGSPKFTVNHSDPEGSMCRTELKQLNLLKNQTEM